MSQLLFKYIWQRDILRRQNLNLPRGETPVFLWIDEAQRFLTDLDRDWPEACRSAWASTVFLTQSMSNLYATMPGHDRSEADALVGNLGTKIFHRNGDKVTNEWAADTITRGLVARRNGSVGYNESQSMGVNAGGSSGYTSSNDPKGSSTNGSRNWGWNWGKNSGYSANSGWQEQVDHLVRPEVFTYLKGGGRDDNYEVQGIVYKPGKRFYRTKRNFAAVTFRQK